jgi:hypothetical protein
LAVVTVATTAMVAMCDILMLSCSFSFGRGYGR